MSNYVVFDSQNQRWMAPRRELNLFDREGWSVKCGVVLGLALSIFFVSGLTLARYFDPVFDRNSDLLTDLSLSCIFPLVTFGIGLANRFSLHKTRTIEIQRYVQQFGWSDFEKTNPDQGLSCFVVKYEDTSPV